VRNRFPGKPFRWVGFFERTPSPQSHILQRGAVLMIDHATFSALRLSRIFAAEHLKSYRSTSKSIRRATSTSSTWAGNGTRAYRRRPVLLPAGDGNNLGVVEVWGSGTSPAANARTAASSDPVRIGSSSASSTRFTLAVQPGIKDAEFASGRPRTAADITHTPRCARTAWSVSLGPDPSPLRSDWGEMWPRSHSRGTAVDCRVPARPESPVGYQSGSRRPKK